MSQSATFFLVQSEGTVNGSGALRYGNGGTTRVSMLALLALQPNHTPFNCQLNVNSLHEGCLSRFRRRLQSQIPYSISRISYSMYTRKGTVAVLSSSGFCELRTAAISFSNTGLAKMIKLELQNAGTGFLTENCVNHSYGGQA